jgi:rare lipoprotein A (peptidoglycan hydrolase)
MRRVLAVLGTTLLALSTAAPAAADARAERAELLLRIAELTDRTEDAEAAVVTASTRELAAARELRRTRTALRERAVNAYLYGAGVPEAARRGPAVYLEVAIQKSRQVLDDARAARLAAEAVRDDAEDARRRLRATGAQLAVVRAELDRQVAADDARREAEQRAADEARRRANAQRAAEQAKARAGGGLLPRHRAATARQIELMGRYPFGPLPSGDGLPAGLRYTGQVISGKASWYGPGFHGRATASGAIYDQEGWTTASRDLPLGTLLVVSRGDKRVLLLVNDRGPYVYDRVLDLSHAAAAHLGVGVTPVEARVVSPS